jgi:hypothetical protein
VSLSKAVLMPIVKVGDRLIKFPDSMEKSEIRDILREKRSDFAIGIDAVTGPQAVFKRNESGNLVEEGQSEEDVSLITRDDLKATIMIESGGNPDAQNAGGFKGLLQYGAARAKELGVDDPFDPKAATTGYFKHAEQASKALQKDGLPVDALNTYLLWQQGMTGGRDILKGLASPLKGFKREKNMKNNLPPDDEFRATKNPTVQDWYDGWKRVFNNHKETASLDVEQFLA